MTCGCFCPQCQHCDEHENVDPKEEYAKQLALVEAEKTHLRYWLNTKIMREEDYEKQMRQLIKIEESLSKMYSKLI